MVSNIKHQFTEQYQNDLYSPKTEGIDLYAHESRLFPNIEWANCEVNNEFFKQSFQTTKQPQKR